MPARFDYIVVGGGLAAASAAEGIRDQDGHGSLLLLSAESHLPYHRPPLSKQLWTGKKAREQVFIHNPDFYSSHGVELALNRRVERLDPIKKTVRDAVGAEYEFGTLLLATGGAPRRLSIPGGDSPGVLYFHTLEDYDDARLKATPGTRCTVIGGGFIGSELAAALNINGVEVTMVFPGPRLCSRVFPAGLGYALQRIYEERGIRIIHDTPSSIIQSGSRLVTHTRNGEIIPSDFIIAGVGILPRTELADDAGLITDNGVLVDRYLRTSHPNIYAAGDNAQFPYEALGRTMRVEHWDNALAQGRLAGRNMAGAEEPYRYMPYFFSDLFEFGYEAVGEVSARMETVADWKTENEVGILYYLRNGQVRGVMMCNVWGKVEDARNIILHPGTFRSEELAGKIPFD